MKCLINIGKVCHNSRKVLSFCQFGRGGGHKKLILSQLQSCGLFIESLFSIRFSHHSERFAHCHSERSEESTVGFHPLCHSERSEESIREFIHTRLYIHRLSADSAAGHAVAVCPLGGCCVAAGGLKTIGYLSALQSNNLNPALASCDSGCNAVQLREAQLNEHCSSSFLTRLFYHYLFHTSCNAFGGLGSAFGKGLGLLSLNQSKI